MTDPFFEAVVTMRENQKEYFKTRTPSSLKASKEFERRVDAMIRERQREKPKQISLFD